MRSCFLSIFVEFRSAVSEEKSKMSQPIRGQGGHLVFFFDRTEKHKLGRGHWDLASCQVSLNSVHWFQRKSRKCEKLTTTDDGRTKDNLRLRCTKNGKTKRKQWEKKRKNPQKKTKRKKNPKTKQWEKKRNKRKRNEKKKKRKETKWQVRKPISATPRKNILHQRRNNANERRKKRK